MPAGRPSKYEPAMCQRVMDLLKEGRSIAYLARSFGVSKQRIYDWAQAHEEFRDALQHGKDWSEAWWEEQGRENLVTKEFQTGLWYANMKNRFGWRDKVEQSGDPDRPIKHELEVTVRPQLSKEEWLAQHGIRLVSSQPVTLLPRDDDMGSPTGTAK